MATIAIPARLKSTRFPGKVLVDILGHPMLWHVYQAVSEAKSAESVYILTDSEEVFQTAASWGAKVLMTDEDCPSGTARIASVIDRLEGDLIVNVQADEPLIIGSIVDEIVKCLEETDADVATPVFKIVDADDLTNTNVNKVVCGSDGRALYFSRSPIPHVRDQDLLQWTKSYDFWGHIGVYGFKRGVLEEYLSLPEGLLESAEKLEQLRLLEAGKQIFTVQVDYKPIGVDVPHDLVKVRTIMESRSLDL